MRLGTLLAAALLLLPPTAVSLEADGPEPAPRRSSPAQPGRATGPVSKLPVAQVEAIEVVVSNEISRLGIPGLSLAIAHEGQIVFANGYGFADIENFVSAKADTAYRIASISKTLTAVVALQLAERGALDLDAPVHGYCPAFPKKRWPVTSRQLLGHQGGIRHYRDGEQPMTRRCSKLEEALTLFKEDPLEFEPDTNILYTTYGYCLLGCVIEGITGQPFAVALREALLSPADLGRTQPEDVHALIPNRARGYTRDGQGALVNSALADVSCKVPGGGLSSTAPDVARFGLALVSGQLLGREWLEKMLTLQRTRGGQTAGVGLGVSLEENDGQREVWKDGAQAGVSTMLYLGAGEGPVVAVLTNHEGIAPALRPLARRIAQCVLADPSIAR